MTRRIRRNIFITVASMALAVCVGAGWLFAYNAPADSADSAGSGVAGVLEFSHDDLSGEITAEPISAEEVAAARLSRFAAVDIVLDTKDSPLAAYQVTFSAVAGDVRIVSIEGGEHQAFAEPPFYDPKAIQNERAILAGFSTNQAKNLPKGRVRVATVHVEVRGEVEPQYELKLSVAATVGGETIPVQVVVQTQRGAL